MLISELFLKALMPITDPFSSIKSVIAVSVQISTFLSFKDKTNLATPALPIVNLLSFQPHLSLMGKSKIYLVNSFAKSVFQPGRAPKSNWPSTWVKFILIGPIVKAVCGCCSLNLPRSFPN